MSLTTLILSLGLTMAAPAAQDQTGVVSGVVTQTGGAPLPGAQVRMATVVGGLPRTATTDSEGRFLFDGVAASSLRVTVEHEGYFGPAESVLCPQTGTTVIRLPAASHPPIATLCVSLQPRQRVDNLAVTLVPGGTIRGRILDPDGNPAVTATVQNIPVEGTGVAQTVQTNDRGEYRLYWVAPGSYLVGVTPRAPATPPDPIRTPTQTYFPGALDSQDALPLVVAPGSDQVGIDFTIQTIRTITISGRFLTTIPPRLVNGTLRPGPAPGLTLIPRAATELDRVYPPPTANSSPSRDQGGFEIRGVRAGVYDLLANVGDETGRQHMGKLEVQAGSVNIDNLVLPLYPGVNVSGKVSLSPRLRLATPQLAQNTRIQLMPAGASPGLSSWISGRIPSVASDPSGNFTVQNVIPGRYVVSQGGPFYVLDVRHNGTSVLRENIQVAEQAVDNIEVVLDETARISGTIRDAQQQPLANATVLLIPDAARRGDLALFKVAKTNAMGRWSINGITPGEYRISVWADAMPALEAFDLKTLDAIEPFSMPIPVLAGTVLELQHIGRAQTSPVLLIAGRKQFESRPIQITPADAAQASVEGRAWKGSQQAPGATVVLIPDGPRRADPSQFKTVTASGTGYFVFRGGLSGRYTAVAFESLPAGALTNPQFLAEHEQKGRIVDIDPAGSVTVQLNIIP